jgi:hypothetical protein
LIFDLLKKSLALAVFSDHSLNAAVTQTCFAVLPRNQRAPCDGKAHRAKARELVIARSLIQPQRLANARKSPVFMGNPSSKK